MRVYDTKTQKYLPDSGIFDEDVDSWGDSGYLKMVLGLDGHPIILSSHDGGKEGLYEHFVDYKEYEGRFQFEKL